MINLRRSIIYLCILIISIYPSIIYPSFYLHTDMHMQALGCPHGLRSPFLLPVSRACACGGMTSNTDYRMALRCLSSRTTFTIRSIEFLIGAIGSQELSRFQICPRTISWARLGGPNFTQSKMSREHVLRARLLFVPRRRAPRRPGGWRSPPWRCRKQPSRAFASCPCAPSYVAASLLLRSW